MRNTSRRTQQALTHKKQVLIIWTHRNAELLNKQLGVFPRELMGRGEAEMGAHHAGLGSPTGGCFRACLDSPACNQKVSLRKLSAGQIVGSYSNRGRLLCLL